MARVLWVGTSLLAASMGCLALSLGASQGSALIGHPLDVSFPVTLGDGESAASVCATAQVFFADDAVPVGGVKTTVVAGTQTQLATVRVQTSAPVVEAFARVELQVGCEQRVTRSYVLLADLSPAAAVSPVAGANPALVGVGSADGAAAVRPVAARPTANTAPPPVRKRTAPTDAMSPPARPLAATAELQGSKLKLDPLELMASANQLQPSLRLSVDAPVESVENADLEQRRQAARLLWKALNDSPEQLAANALKAEVSEAEANRAKAELGAAQQAAQTAQAQLQEEQDNRFTHPSFLALFAALLAALVGLVWVLRRQRRDGGSSQAPPWWKNHSVPHTGDDVAPPPVAKPGFFERFKSQTKVATGGKKARQKEPSLDIDVDTLMPEDAWPTPAPAAPRTPDAKPSMPPSDFANSAMFEGARSVATEELFDLQQQVEFFISLGQADQAIHVLQAHLSDSDEASPLAYLDLLKLYHELGRREDYAALQARFNSTFSGNAPDFDRYATSRRGLERYESALSRIQSLWPQPAVLQVIERSIFRSEPGDQPEVFDLEAYRELLLLYGIARDVIEGQAADSRLSEVNAPANPQKGEPVATDSQQTTMQPLPITMGPAVGGLVASLEAENGGATTNVGDDDGPTLVPDDAPAPLDGLGSVGLDLDLSLDEGLSLPPDLPTLPLGHANGSLSGGADFNAKRTPNGPSGNVLDLDFSALGEPETFTIKKSGKPD